MILVTGANGFIGKHLLTHLICLYGKQHIVALTSKPIESCAYVLHDNYQFDAGIFIKNGFAQIDTIIHAGAFIPKKANEVNDLALCNSNIYNTQKLIEANLPNLRKFIFLSTVDVYGHSDIILENSLEKPVSLYGYSKLYGEKMIEEWGKTNSKIIQNLRVGHVYGPGEETYQKIIPVSFNKLLTNQPLQIWGSGQELRAFIYVNDIVKAIVKSIALEEHIGVVNLVSEQSISVKNLVYKIKKLSSSDVPVETISTDNTGRNLVFDNSKMKKWLLNKEKTLDSGLQEEFDYMKMLSLEQ